MNREQLQGILRRPYNAGMWQELLINLFGASEIRQIPSTLTSDSNEKVEGFELGRLYTADRYEIGLFAFEIKQGHNVKLNRVGLRSLVHSYTRYNVDAALVIYYDATHWRLSFICDLKDQKTAPKRFTYVFGNPGESYRTAVDRLSKLTETKPNFEQIKDAFSVEKLSKDFFKGYREQYTKFCKHIGGVEKWQRDYVKKMMGRLVFLQFLQKKGWMGVPVANTVWEGGDLQYTQNLVARHTDNDMLLSDVLEPLFFDTLNTKREKDIANSILGNDIKIPYLNGGLFDKDRLDEKKIDFPYSYFVDLMDFFSQYNFTIDENDPYDAEVGIDPEMLGHIFENLLEDNKDKGAFYTPKEIVQYMCRQSLIEYLQSKLGKHAEIENFINNHDIGNRLDSKNYISANAKAIEQLLDEVKICDPAIGSGAFPMGILNEIFHAKMTLNMTLDRAEVKKNIIQNSIYGVDIEQGAVDIARLRFWLSLVVDDNEPQPLPNLDYKIMCGNSLLSRYSLDMHFDDVFKEYNKGKNDQEKMNLDRYKKMVADYTNTSDHHEKEFFRQTIEAVKNAFRTEFSIKERFKLSQLRGEIDNLEYAKLFGERMTKEQNKLEKKRLDFAKLNDKLASVELNKLYENSFEWRFELPALLDEEGRFVGFDIVIGNPPYLRIQGIREANPAFADELVNQYKSATGSYDLYANFVERGLQVINSEGVVNYIMPIKWTNSAFGKGLRTVVSGSSSACKIINFGAYQVFNASTYTALQWFKPNSDTLSYMELDRSLNTNKELGSYLDSLRKDDFAQIASCKLKSDAWVLTVGDTTKILNKLEKNPRRISDVFDRIFCGLQTSKDDVYFLYECTEVDNYVVGYSKHLKREIKVERGLLKPLLKGEDVHRYDNIKTDRFVVFPYILGDGKANLYTEKELSELFPKGYSYLKECEDVLRGREKGRLIDDEFWYRYIYPKNLILFDNEKLVAPDISLGGNFAYDERGEFYQTTTIYGYIKKHHITESYKCWAAILNSRLCWWFLVNTGTTLANGYFRFKPDYINRLPVPEEVPSDVDDTISNLVDLLTYLYDGKNPDIFDHTSNKRVRAHLEDVLNLVVYELYFGEHMREKGIDVIADLKSYKFEKHNMSIEIEHFYTWYQKSENKIRQKLMLLETRSKDALYVIHTTAAL